jgi:hypothetical protein
VRIVLLALILSGASLAQNPAEPQGVKAPPEVDEALRARISEFYQAHVDGKFRLAYDLVADDSKDLYFAAEKERYTDFSIQKIEYLEDFTKAKAVVACGKEVAMLGKRYPVKLPLATDWKLQDGKWFWYRKQTEGVETPFGTMHPGPGSSQDADKAKRAPRLQALQSLVKLDKREIKLSMSEPSSDQVVVTNHLPGSVSLSVVPPRMPGLEVKLDRKDLAVNEAATLQFRFDPPNKPPRPMARVLLLVFPTNQTIPIRVTFSGGPPEPPAKAAPQEAK